MSFEVGLLDAYGCFSITVSRNVIIGSIHISYIQSICVYIWCKNDRHWQQWQTADGGRAEYSSEVFHVPAENTHHEHPTATAVEYIDRGHAGENF